MAKPKARDNLEYSRLLYLIVQREKWNPQNPYTMTELSKEFGNLSLQNLSKKIKILYERGFVLRNYIKDSKRRGRTATITLSPNLKQYLLSLSKEDYKNATLRNIENSFAIAQYILLDRKPKSVPYKNNLEEAYEYVEEKIMWPLVFKAKKILKKHLKQLTASNF